MAAAQFLTEFSDLIERASSDGSCISEIEERHFILRAAETCGTNRLGKATLRWVLATHVHSPHVRLQYERAQRILTLFPSVGSPEIFAVMMDADGNNARLITNATDVSDMSSGSHAYRSSDALLLGESDHLAISPPCPGASIIVLYAHVGHPKLAIWLRALSAASSNCKAFTALRFAPPPPAAAGSAARSKPLLQGFTAHVTLRSTEYKVVDDRVFQTRLFLDCPPDVTIANCNEDPTFNSDEFTWPRVPVNDSELSFTPLHAAHFVIHSASNNVTAAIDALASITEDGPSVTRSSAFASIAPNLDEQKEILKNVRRFQATVGERSTVLLNGFQLDTEGLRQGANGLLRCLSFLSSATQQLDVVARNLGLPVPPAPRSVQTGSQRLRVLLPTKDLAPNAVVWLNDMHSDSRYKSWPALNLSNRANVEKFAANVNEQRGRSVSEMMQHARLVKVRAHIVSLTLIIDPGDIEHLAYIAIPESIVRGDLPIRVSLALIPNSNTSRLACAAFYYFLRAHGRKTAVQFLGMLRQIIDYFGGPMRGVNMSEKIVDIAFRQIVSSVGSQIESVLEILENDHDVLKILNESHHFAEEMRLFSEIDEDERDPADPENLKRVSFLCTMNGVVIKNVAKEVVALAISEQQRIASILSAGAFADEDIKNIDADRWVSSDESIIVVNKLSRDMRNSDSRRLSENRQKEGPSRLLAKDVVSAIEDVRSVKYEEEGSSISFNMTVWLAGRKRGSEGFRRAEQILREAALSTFATRTSTRFALIEKETRLHESIMRTISKRDEDDSVFVINGRRIASASVENVDDLIVEVAYDFQEVVLPTDMQGELRLLYRMYEIESKEACQREGYDGEKEATETKILKAVKTSKLQALCVPETLAEDSNVDEKPPLTLLAVINPVEKNAYVTAALLRALRSTYSEEDLRMGIIVVPAISSAKTRIDPPKTFYKFLLTPDDLANTAIDGGRFATRLSFNRLPQESVLTVALEPPRAWFVSSHATNYDMDNVILDNVSGNNDLFTEYELKNLIVEGSCIDELERPPQGLKLILSNDGGISVDTLVMANLGYFQLKVPTPGMWWLSLAHGASSRIFTLRAMETYKTEGRSIFEADEDGRVPIPVESLSGAGGILLRVVRKPGMEGVSLLTPNDVEKKLPTESIKKKSNVLDMLKDNLSRLFPRKSSWTDNGFGNIDEEDSGTINVFSVASGHLYERFLKIMISSVTKHASRKVKFWLLENYLSPSFKKLLPEFTKEHGAEVGMVTYRWPSWLRAQSEKQRIIWAYKILFLDVLFPLNVKRIIFIDSDQVIRGDIAELMDIDLKGAPYGYVPFCDSRKEVEGYRFWKQGFWKETLRGAKYRISALYVVDLDRFRETAAGDTLRFIYQSLSADPNSLSNLDQDLPNYASVNSITGTSVPIFDLPQEWLWCESWCDDESKNAAKAIDLCNNPMTKEPKLDSAKRIISEWVELDNNASQLTEVIYKRLQGQDKIMPPTVEPTTNVETAGADKEDGIKSDL